MDSHNTRWCGPPTVKRVMRSTLAIVWQHRLGPWRQSILIRVVGAPEEIGKYKKPFGNPTLNTRNLMNIIKLDIVHGHV